MATRVDPQNKSSRNSDEGSWVPDLSFSWSSPNLLKQFALILVVLIVGLVAYDFYRYGMTSPRYGVNLEVNGLNKIPKTRIRTVLRPMVGSNDNPKSLLQVSVTEVRKKLIKEVPRFKSVSVRKKYPDRLVVNVDERVPIALVARYDSKKDRKIYLPADKSGTLFEPTPSEARNLPDKVPVVKGLASYDPDSESYRRRWERARKIIQAVNEQFNDDIMNWVQIIPGGYARIQINRPKRLEVQLGLDRYDKKVKKLYEMIQTSQFIRINEYIDLSDLNNIRVR